MVYKPGIILTVHQQTKNAMNAMLLLQSLCFDLYIFKQVQEFEVTNADTTWLVLPF